MKTCWGRGAVPPRSSILDLGGGGTKWNGIDGLRRPTALHGIRTTASTYGWPIGVAGPNQNPSEGQE